MSFEKTIDWTKPFKNGKLLKYCWSCKEDETFNMEKLYLLVQKLALGLFFDASYELFGLIYWGKIRKCLGGIIII